MRTSLAAILVLMLPLVCMAERDVASSGKDNGYAMFVLVSMEWEELKSGRKIGHETTRGFVFSDNERSPFYQAVLYCRNTMIKESGSDEVVAETSFCELQDHDGDLAWLVKPIDAAARLDFMSGIGKFAGISGSLKGVGGINRQDETHMSVFEANWAIK